MIDRPDFTRRIATVTSWVTLIDGRVDGTTDQLAQIHRAGLDLRHIDNNTTIRDAWTHLTEQQPGYPRTSMPAPAGTGGYSNRTLNLAVPDHDTLDPVASDIAQIEHLLAGLASTARLIADTRAAGISVQRGTTRRPASACLEDDAQTLRFLMLRWAKRPDVRWCSSCARNGGHRQTVDGTRYKDVCRWCGEWRRTNKALPPIEILRARHSGQRLSKQMLARHHVKLPKRSKAST